MNDSIRRKKDTSASSWEQRISEKRPIGEWQDSAFHAALEKLQAEHGHPDTVMRMGEAFGRGLFAQQIKDKTPDWTIKQWIEEIQKDVYRPLGTEFTFTKVSQDVATTFMKRNPLAQTANEQTAASLFHFGVMRGLFLSAFPKGELLINIMRNDDQPEFIFKMHASAKDKLERQRIIHALTFLKKEDGA
jgi:hypothetical protein